MPELPEVETMVRGIQPHVVGREIASVRRCRCTFKPISVSPSFRRFAERVRGERVSGVTRLAKRVVLELTSGERIAIEPRMTGLVLLCDPPDRAHLRLEFRFSGNGPFDRLWFWDRRGLGTVRLYTPLQFAVELGPATIGPDALVITEREWTRRCAGTDRPIKVALLDQRFLAGIGNLYASEILHAAGVHPTRRTSELKPRHVHRLFSALRSVLEEAIRYEGSTLGDATYRNALSRNGRYQNAHRVYKREGEKCLTCRRGHVRRIVQAQRSTFFCPVCQKEP